MESGFGTKVILILIKIVEIFAQPAWRNGSALYVLSSPNLRRTVCLTISTETSNLKAVGSSPTVGSRLFGKKVNSRVNFWVGDSPRIVRIII